MMMDFGIFELENLQSKGSYFLSEYKNCGQYKAISIIHNGYAITLTTPGRSDFDVPLLVDKLKEGIE